MNDDAAMPNRVHADRLEEHMARDRGTVSGKVEQMRRQPNELLKLTERRGWIGKKAPVGALEPVSG